MQFLLSSLYSTVGLALLGQYGLLVLVAVGRRHPKVDIAVFHAFFDEIKGFESRFTLQDPKRRTVGDS